jgi:signal transduction histidine kinase
MQRLSTRLVTYGALLAGLMWTAAARAERPLDAASHLRGSELGRHMALLEDPGGRLGIEDVSGPGFAARFVDAAQDVPNFGFTGSTYWVRLSVVNASAGARPWLLELAYPLLDDVTIYEPRTGGRFTARQTGDMRPFKQRDLAYRNFVFSLEEAPRSARTLYLRVATTGALTLPLRAWSMKEFVEHQHLDWAALCIFYGVVLVMACYNACVYAVTRQREYLPYAAYIVSVAVLEFTFAGHTFQFLSPDNVWLAHHLSPASFAASLMFACAVVKTYLPSGHTMRNFLRYYEWYCGFLIAASFVVPYSVIIKLLAASALLLSLWGMGAAVALVHARVQGGRIFLIGWGSVMLGSILSALQGAGLLPTHFLINWSVQIGISIQVVLLASALADKINTARAELSAVNEALSRKLDALSAALNVAEQANQEAEQATRAKQEFIATMSHEFRTPLNPIINIPEGLLQEFARHSRAVCATCNSQFELEPGDTISPQSSCPECSTRGSLSELSVAQFEGDAARARRFLAKIGSSGLHLLQVVNGILEFSQMEAGRLALLREHFDVAEVVAEALEEMREPARRRGIQLTSSVSAAQRQLFADRHRLREVLVHLIDNAIKFSSGPGRVTIWVELEGDSLVFSVADEGIGIPSQHHTSIFTSFEQVHKGNTRRFGGTGLGLSNARSLVRMHGGEMWVESVPEQGSIFYFSIPLRQRAGASRAPQGMARGPA